MRSRLQNVVQHAAVLGLRVSKSYSHTSILGHIYQPHAHILDKAVPILSQPAMPFTDRERILAFLSTISPRIQSVEEESTFALPDSGAVLHPWDNPLNSISGIVQGEDFWTRWDTFKETGMCGMAYFRWHRLT